MQCIRSDYHPFEVKGREHLLDDLLLTLMLVFHPLTGIDKAPAMSKQTDHHDKVLLGAGVVLHRPLDALAVNGHPRRFA